MTTGAQLTTPGALGSGGAQHYGLSRPRRASANTPKGHHDDTSRTLHSKYQGQLDLSSLSVGTRS